MAARTDEEGDEEDGGLFLWNNVLWLQRFEMAARQAPQDNGRLLRG